MTIVLVGGVFDFKCPKCSAMRIDICRAYGAFRIEALFSTGSRRWLSKCRRYAASEPAPLSVTAPTKG